MERDVALGESGARCPSSAERSRRTSSYVHIRTEKPARMKSLFPVGVGPVTEAGGSSESWYYTALKASKAVKVEVDRQFPSATNGLSSLTGEHRRAGSSDPPRETALRNHPRPVAVR